MKLVTSGVACLLWMAEVLSAQPRPQLLPQYDYSPRIAPGVQGSPGWPAFDLKLAQFHPGGSYLGVGVVEVTDEMAAEAGLANAYGVKVTSVAKESPAEEAALQRGDLILEYMGQKVLGVQNFVRLVQETPAGRKVPLAVMRGGSRTEITVAIGQRPPFQGPRAFFRCDPEEEDCTPRLHDFTIEFDMPVPRMVFKSSLLGAQIERIDGQLAEYFGVEEGLLVRQVEAGSPAERAELQAGDIIVSVAGQVVEEVDGLREAIREAPPGEDIPIEVLRDKGRLTLRMGPREERTRGRDRRGAAREVRGERL